MTGSKYRNLKPSEIRFCQNSIGNEFNMKSKHADKKVGETLDDLLRGQCAISNIPIITVVCYGGDWYTADNRRLWVFKWLQRLGRCDEILVKIGRRIPPNKFTAKYNKKPFHVRGDDPGGVLWKRLANEQKADENPSGTLSNMHHERPVPELCDEVGPTNGRCSSRPYENQRNDASPSVMGIHYNQDEVNEERSADKDFLTRDRREYPRQNVGWSTPLQSPPDLSFHLRSLSLSDSKIELLDPEDVRYTKTTIKAPPSGSSYQHTNPILVYRAFDENWALDGNRRLCSFKKARQYNRGQTIQAIVKDDEDEFLEKMRSDRPWLTVLDILQMGETETVERCDKTVYFFDKFLLHSTLPP